MPDLQVVVPDGLPNIDAAAAACGVVLGDPPLDVASVNGEPEAQVCICAEAADSVDNVARELFCFSRPPPSITLLRPSLSNPADVFAACEAADCPAGVLPVPTDLAASVAGEFDLTACTFSVTSSSGVLVLSGDGAIDQKRCDVSVPLVQGAPLVDGSYIFTVTATDLTGRTTEASDSFLVDTRVDAVAITSPANNAHVSILSPSTTFSVTGTASDSAGLSEITVAFTGAFSLNRILAGTSTWTATVTSPVAGATDFAATATDNFGNKATTPTRRALLDAAPPVIVVQPVAFKDEGPNVPITKTGAVSANTLAYVPNGPAVTPSWILSDAPSQPGGTTPVIRRWVTRLNSSSETPRISFAVTDTAAGGTTDPALLTATFGIGTSCPTAEQATNPATRVAGVFTAAIRDDRTAVDLSAQTGVTNLCLGFFVKDEAQNTRAKFVFFRFQTIIPPLEIEFGSTLYSPEANAADAGSVDIAAVDSWFHLTNAAFAAPGYAVDHALIYNPHGQAIEASLVMSGTYDVRFLFGEQMDISNEELERFWGNPSEQLSSPTATGSDACPSNSSGGTSPLWRSNNFSGAVIIDPPLAPAVTGCSSPPPSQASHEAPSKYESAVSSDARFPRRFGGDGQNTGNIVDNRNDLAISGFTNRAPTLSLFTLNNDGTLGTAIPVSGGFAPIPSRTRVVLLFRVRHNAPSATDFIMDCSAVASDFDADCPLFSNNLQSSSVDASPAPSVVPNFSGRCIMRTFDGAPGCATIFQSDDDDDALSCQNNVDPHAACYIDKAFWFFTQAQIRTTSASSLSQTYRVDGVTSSHSGIARDATTRFIQ